MTMCPLQVSATDADSGEGGTVTYSILSRNEEGIFTLDPVTGWLGVINGGKINRDLKPVYYLAIEATDGMWIYSENDQVCFIPKCVMLIIGYHSNQTHKNVHSYKYM